MTSAVDGWIMGGPAAHGERSPTNGVLAMDEIEMCAGCGRSLPGDDAVVMVTTGHVRRFHSVACIWRGYLARMDELTGLPPGHCGQCGAHRLAQGRPVAVHGGGL